MDSPSPLSVSALVKNASDLLRVENEQSDKEVTVTGFLLVRSYGIYDDALPLIRCKEEGFNDYVKRTWEADVIRSDVYRVEIPDENEHPLIVFDKKVRRYLLPHKQDGWKRLIARLSWQIHQWLYSPVFRRFAPFEQNAILLDDGNVLPAIERVVSAYIFGTRFTHKLHVEVTGRIAPPTDFHFSIAMSNVRKIRILDSWLNDGRQETTILLDDAL